MHAELTVRLQQGDESSDHALRSRLSGHGILPPSARISWANRSHSQVDAEGRLESPRPNNDHRPSWQDSWGVNLLTNPRCYWGILVVSTSILLFQRVRNASLLEMGY